MIVPFDTPDVSNCNWGSKETYVLKMMWKEVCLYARKYLLKACAHARQNRIQIDQSIWNISDVRRGEEAKENTPCNNNTPRAALPSMMGNRHRVPNSGNIATFKNNAVARPEQQVGEVLALLVSIHNKKHQIYII